jgi:hypothetical protein
MQMRKWVGGGGGVREPPNYWGKLLGRELPDEIPSGIGASLFSPFDGCKDPPKIGDVLRSHFGSGLCILAGAVHALRVVRQQK